MQRVFSTINHADRYTSQDEIHFYAHLAAYVHTKSAQD